MNYKAVCDVCGFKYPADRLRKRWDGYMVCIDDWEPRHKQDSVPVKTPDPHPLPFTRPNQTGADNVDLNQNTLTSVPTGTFDDNNGTL